MDTQAMVDAQLLPHISINSTFDKPSQTLHPSPKDSAHDRQPEEQPSPVPVKSGTMVVLTSQTMKGNNLALLESNHEGDRMRDLAASSSETLSPPASSHDTPNHPLGQQQTPVQRQSSKMLCIQVPSRSNSDRGNTLGSIPRGKKKCSASASAISTRDETGGHRHNAGPSQQPQQPQQQQSSQNAPKSNTITCIAFMAEWVTRFITNGYSGQDIRTALKAAGCDLLKAETVLECLREGKGIPTESGVWTNEDDRLLDDKAAESDLALSSKHGHKQVKSRRSFLVVWTKEML